MSWQAAAWLMLGGSTVLLFLGLPVAFSFLVINLIGALIFLGGEAGLEWANEISEAMLYLVTLLTAPWLMRKGQHIRVDILLRAVPDAVGWAFEWIVDALAMSCCAVIAWYGARAALASWQAGSMSIKTLITPEWWLLCVLPLAFLALTLEMFFRMRRLYLGPRAPRDDAVSTG